jgi:dihydroorotase
MSHPTFLIKNVKLLVTGFTTDEPRDIKIEDGIITAIGRNLDNSSSNGSLQILNNNQEELWASLSWVDLRANFGEPGEEYKETWESGSRAAVAGGFSRVLLMPNTQPVVDSKAGIQAINKFSGKLPLQLLAAAAVSVGAHGEQLTEILDLHHAGAIAFSDGNHPVSDPSLILKILQYLQRINGLFINQATEPKLSAGAQMHEGVVSTTLGMKGVPVLAERIAIKRDLDLLRYAGGKLHISGVSSAEGVQLIKEAKEEGLPVTCDTYTHNLLFTDSDLTGFDTNLKLEPPLRTELDRKALLAGLEDGTIDAVATDHRPQDTECKRLEFDLASPGAIGLQTAYSILKKAGLADSTIVQKLAIKPREILNLAGPKLEVGQMADLTLFNPNQDWVFDKATNKSKCTNSPLWGQKLTGKAVGVFSNGKYYFDAELAK